MVGKIEPNYKEHRQEQDSRIQDLTRVLVAKFSKKRKHHISIIDHQGLVPKPNPLCRAQCAHLAMEMPEITPMTTCRLLHSFVCIQIILNLCIKVLYEWNIRKTF